MNVTATQMDKAHWDFEQAIVDLATKAVDGMGRQVLLAPYSETADDFRRVIRAFMSGLIDPNVVFLNLTGGDGLQQSAASEVAAWNNLALLARATAAAIEAGR